MQVEELKEVESRLPYMSMKGYCEEAKTTYHTVYGKIRSGKWQEGREYFYDPDGKLWIILEGANSWLTQGVFDRMAMESKSRFRGEAKGTDPHGRTSQQREISKRQPAYVLT